MKAIELYNILLRAKKVINKKNTLPILDCVVIRDGELTACGIDDRMTFYIAKNKGLEGFDAVINFAQLNKLIAKIKKLDISFEMGEELLSIKCSKGTFKLDARTFNADDFPEYPGTFHKVTKFDQQIVDNIQRAFPYVADDQLRPVMNNVLVDKNGYVVGSDAHKLCFFKCNPIPLDILIGSTLIDKPCNVLSDEDNNWYKFDMGDEVIIQKADDGTYPAWQNVVPKNYTKSVVFDKNTLLEQLDFCSLSANKASYLGRFHFRKENSQIFASDTDFKTEFSSEIPNLKSKEDLCIGFKIPFLSGILKSLDKKQNEVEIEMIDEARAIRINGEIILMPMMINV